MNDLVNMTDAALMIGISRSYIGQKRHKIKGFPKAIQNNGLFYFDRKEIEEYIKTRPIRQERDFWYVNIFKKSGFDFKKQIYILTGRYYLL